MAHGDYRFELGQAVYYPYRWSDSHWYNPPCESTKCPCAACNPAEKSLKEQLCDLLGIDIDKVNEVFINISKDGFNVSIDYQERSENG